jgi:hypothetical protein
LCPTGYNPNTLTHAGESLKKAVKEGRVKLEDLPNPRKRPRGQTRGQVRLVRCQPPNDIDLRTAFVLCVAGVYCAELALVNGTLACSAVLGYLNSPKVLNRVMGNVKVKFEKLHNRSHLLKSAAVIHGFIHDGDAAAVKRKVLLYRSMAGAMHSNEESEMAYRIVELLVRVAAGREPNDENKWGFYPYGKSAAHSTMAFKACPSPWFANALTFLYPYLLKPKSQWKELAKKYTHPMNATGLWPVNLLKRYMSFFSLFRASRLELFASYQSQDGIYHGRDTDHSRTVTKDVSSPKLTQKDVDDMSDESEDSVDGVF